MITIGASIGLTMILIASMMKEFFPFLFLFSIGFGFCNGFTYMVPMQHGWLWFPDKPGLISGIIIGGFGIGTFALNLICEHIVNPENIQADSEGKFPSQVNKRVPRMLATFALICTCFAIIGCLMIFPGPDSTNLNDKNSSQTQQNNSELTEKGHKNFSIQEDTNEQVPVVSVLFKDVKSGRQIKEEVDLDKVVLSDE